MNIEEILQQPDGSIETISLNLDFVDFAQRQEALLRILAKLSKTGSISISGMDIYSFSKSVTYGSRTLEEANAIIQQSRSMDYLDNVKLFMIQNNLKIETCKRENGYYVCTARYKV